jgi:endonuclease-8
MPEGDSLHRAAARLQALVGDRVEASSPHPRGAATWVAAAVDGRVLEGVEAVGKNLYLRFEGGVTVRSHLRLRGRWRVEPRGAGRAGSPWLVLRGACWEAVLWNGSLLAVERAAAGRRALGPDLLADDVHPSAVLQRLRRVAPERRLGEALVDQRVVAGIGNMWLAEALWHGRVSPWLPVAGAADTELRSVLAWARSSMRAAVGGPRPRRAVYRRTGRPCPRCGCPIASRGLGEANRIAYWCPLCQRGPEPSPGFPGGGGERARSA